MCKVSPITGLPEQLGAPYRFNHIMSWHTFDQILSGLRFTTKELPTYEDHFWEVRALIKAWNTNMDEEFIAGWLNCLDESMSIWTNEYTCPGFMFVPRKPHLFSNEYHTLCCCLSGVLFRVELMEGKDSPLNRPPELYTEKGKKVGLLLQMTEPLWGTWRALVLDSGFCVLKGIAELAKKVSTRQHRLRNVGIGQNTLMAKQLRPILRIKKSVHVLLYLEHWTAYQCGFTV